MAAHLNRRSFLHHSSCLLAGSAAAVVMGRSAPAAEKKRSGLTLACGDATLSRVKEADCWTALKAIGAEGVEATIAEDLSLPRLFHPTRKYSVATADDRAVLKADMEAAGCRITAFAMHNQFDVRPEAEIEWTAKTAQAAKALGVPAVRIDVVTRKADLEDFLGFSIDMLKKIVAATEATGMVFGIENHGKTTNNPEFLDALFAGVGSDRVGLTLDTGNFYWYG
ncbi:MAG: sugar phosphate isomerase/epimerase family protein, partial [Thermoguttaceae bacterium]